MAENNASIQEDVGETLCEFAEGMESDKLLAGINGNGRDASLDDIRAGIKEIREEVKGIVQQGYRAAVVSIIGQRSPNPHPIAGKTKPNKINNPHHRKHR